MLLLVEGAKREDIGGGDGRWGEGWKTGSFRKGGLVGREAIGRRVLA